MRCEENGFCRTLDSATRKRLCERCVKKTYVAGSILFMEEDFYSRFCVMVSGAIITAENPDRKSLDKDDVPAFCLFTEGSVFSAMSLLDSKRPDGFDYAYLRVISDTVMARIRFDIVEDLFESDIGFVRALMRNMGEWGTRACTFLAALRTQNVYEDVRFLLGYMADKNVELSHQLIADITNHNRVSVTRAVKDLRKSEPDYWSQVKHVLRL